MIKTMHCFIFVFAYLVTSVVNNEEANKVVFALKHSLEEDIELDIGLDGFEVCEFTEHIEFYADDLKTINDKDTERVSSVTVEIGHKVVLKKHFWNMLRYTVNL